MPRLLSCNVVELIDVLVNWYSKLTSAVKWNTCISRWFTVSSGVRQGGVLSPALINVLRICLLMNLEHPVLDVIYLICLLYADDVILLSGSLNDLQSMLSIYFNIYLTWIAKV